MGGHASRFSTAGEELVEKILRKRFRLYSGAKEGKMMRPAGGKSFPGGNR